MVVLGAFLSNSSCWVPPRSNHVSTQKLTYNADEQKREASNVLDAWFTVVFFAFRFNPNALCRCQASLFYRDKRKLRTYLKTFFFLSLSLFLFEKLLMVNQLIR